MRLGMRIEWNTDNAESDQLDWEVRAWVWVLKRLSVAYMVRDIDNKVIECKNWSVEYERD